MADAEELHVTEDGSLTLKDEITGELYHNRAGAFTEALANFVQPLNLPGLEAEKRQLAFLDVCFGLGYNTFVLLCELAKLKLHAESIKIVAVEKFPKPLLYISSVLADDRFAKLKRSIEEEAPELLAGKYGQFSFSLSAGSGNLKVELELLQGDLREVVPQLLSSCSGCFDGILHDPFSPRRAPELWTIDLFDCYRKLLISSSGKVVTYSSASAVRSAFSLCGLTVRRTPAVGGKSGGTLAVLPSADGTISDGLPLHDDEMTKLAGRAGVPYRDETFSKNSAQIVRERELEQRLKFPS